ncbi:MULTISPECIES: VOC family protein [Rhodomicrobium]|uniref:VOC family protein n=1 Tax=Rhodomicrobium TaxID=1068 RepID=UPI000B4BB489|nr:MULTISPECIES: VOC family protein [Rhodomicrobium]
MSSTIIPCLRYRDCPRMIDWLCDTFGFERHFVVPAEDGGIAHAQLTLGGGMIMLGSVKPQERDGEWGRLIKQPADIGGVETQTPCLVVSDVDAVYARAVAAGAEIIIDIKDQDYGSRDFTCRDPEGHIWVIGTYDPWTAQN